MPRVDLRELFERHRSLLEPIVQFVSDHGRIPEQDESGDAGVLISVFGSVRRACRAVLEGVGEEDWIRIRDQRADSLLVYLALGRLSGRPRFSALPAVLQRDIRGIFGSYGRATESADEVLFSAGNMALVRSACGRSLVGKLTSEALYVHVSAIDQLPPILRIYEGCARTFIGSVAGATILKLRFDEPTVSYLAYPGFDKDPHPALASAVVVPLQTFRVNFRDYSGRQNPPVLHRKELFVPADYPNRDRFERLTRQEERWGLLDDSENIGTRQRWESRLAERGVRLMGHRLVRAATQQEGSD